jgi:hypothetical protein
VWEKKGGEWRKEYDLDGHNAWVWSIAMKDQWMASGGVNKEKIGLIIIWK